MNISRIFPRVADAIVPRVHKVSSPREVGLLADASPVADRALRNIAGATMSGPSVVGPTL